MLITGIRSKPVYAPLQPDLAGRYHVMVGHGVGAAPLARLLGELKASAPQALANTRIWYVNDPAAPQSSAEVFHAANAAEVRVFDAIDPLLADLTTALDEALMGTRLYVAGPESFMRLIMRIAHGFNLA